MRRHLDHPAIPPLNHRRSEPEVFKHGFGERLPHRPNRATDVFRWRMDRRRFHLLSSRLWHEGNTGGTLDAGRRAGVGRAELIAIVLRHEMGWPVVVRVCRGRCSSVGLRSRRTPVDDAPAPNRWIPPALFSSVMLRPPSPRRAALRRGKHDASACRSVHARDSAQASPASRLPPSDR